MSPRMCPGKRVIYHYSFFWSFMYHYSLFNRIGSMQDTFVRPEWMLITLVVETFFLGLRLLIIEIHGPQVWQLFHGFETLAQVTIFETLVQASIVYWVYCPIHEHGLHGGWIKQICFLFYFSQVSSIGDNTMLDIKCEYLFKPRFESWFNMWGISLFCKI